MHNTNKRLFSCLGVAVSHTGSSPRSLESWVHVGPGPRLVLDEAQWLKATKCPTGLPLIHTTHSFLNAVIRAQCCSADWTPALCSLQVSVRNYSQAVKSNTVSLLFDKQEETSVSKRRLFFLYILPGMFSLDKNHISLLIKQTEPSCSRIMRINFSNQKQSWGSFKDFFFLCPWLYWKQRMMVLSSREER